MKILLCFHIKLKQKAIFLDRDGIINYERKDYVKNLDEFKIYDGIIDAISSDHSPQNRDSKLLPFAQAKPGSLGLETLFSTTLSLVNSDKLPIEKAIHLITSGPAKVLNLNLGTIWNNWNENWSGNQSDFDTWETQTGTSTRTGIRTTMVPRTGREGTSGSWSTAEETTRFHCVDFRTSSDVHIAC